MPESFYRSMSVFEDPDFPFIHKRPTPIQDFSDDEDVDQEYYDDQPREQESDQDMDNYSNNDYDQDFDYDTDQDYDNDDQSDNDQDYEDNSDDESDFEDADVVINPEPVHVSENEDLYGPGLEGKTVIMKDNINPPGHVQTFALLIW